MACLPKAFATQPSTEKGQKAGRGEGLLVEELKCWRASERLQERPWPWAQSLNLMKVEAGPLDTPTVGRQGPLWVCLLICVCARVVQMAREADRPWREEPGVG